MRTVDRVVETRERLNRKLERYPLLTEVASEIGVSVERIRQCYKELGLDGREGQMASSAKLDLAIMEARDKLAAALGRTPTVSEIHRETGIWRQRIAKCLGSEYVKSQKQERRDAIVSAYRSGLTQCEVASMFGVGQTSISHTLSYQKTLED